MLTDVPTVDSRAWTRQRIEFLENLLLGDVTDEQRSAAERELEELKRKSRGPFRWLFPFRLPHQH
jgi:hypothetical protein